MFGRTKREQQLKAEQQAAEVLAALVGTALRAAADVRIAEAKTDASELERLRAETAQLQKDAARYRWLRERLLAADFDWQESGECALVFAWPKDCAVSGNCDATIDGAMLKTPNASGNGQAGVLACPVDRRVSRGGE